MAKITIKLMAGDTEIVYGKKFSHCVKNVQFWFGTHRSRDVSYGFQITHLESGQKVRDILQMDIDACRGDTVAAARKTIDDLCKKVGADRVYKVLSAAEKPKQVEAENEPV